MDKQKKNPESETDSEYNPLDGQYKLLIGAGGTGKTTLLRQWEDGWKAKQFSADTSAESVWLTSSVGAEKLHVIMESSVNLVVIEDLQWCTDETLDFLIATLEGSRTGEFGNKKIWVSARPWFQSAAFQRVVDLLTENSPPATTGLRVIEEFGSTLAALLGRPVKAEMLNWFYEQTVGSVGLAADIVSTNWHKTPDAPMPDELFFLVHRRVKRCADEVFQLAELLALAPELGLGKVVETLSDDVDCVAAEKGLRSAGVLTPAGDLIPVVAQALSQGQTTIRTKNLNDRLALAYCQSDPGSAVEFALAGSLQNVEIADFFQQRASVIWWQDPKKAWELVAKASEVIGLSDDLQQLQAACAFRLGGGIGAETLRSNNKPVAQMLEVAVAVSEMDWSQACHAANKSAEGEGSPNSRLTCELLVAQTSLCANPPNVIEGGTVGDQTTAGVLLASQGKTSEALHRFAAAANLYDRLSCPTKDISYLLAFTPHRIGALVAINSGDLTAALSLLEQARRSCQNIPGETRTVRLLIAYVQLIRGNYKDAVIMTASQEEPLPDVYWNVRDQLLWSTLKAGLALRSGDISRLTEAVHAAAGLLLRLSPSWLYIEIVHDLFVGVARLGNSKRVQSAVAEITGQCRRLPSSQYGNSASWLELQIGVASKDNGLVAAAAAKCAPQDIDPPNELAAARAHAAQMWLKIVADDEMSRVDESAVVVCAERLGSVSDPWQASRLFGQAALDESDPVAARRLLERARSVVTEVNVTNNHNFAEWGLSDREAEVAALIAKGQPYKKVGEQLFISPKTVEHHVARIRQKLGATSRAEMLQKISSRME